ncbi:hypothetical protein ACFE04_020368 [Oxalis oulophora]
MVHDSFVGVTRLEVVKSRFTLRQEQEDNLSYEKTVAALVVAGDATVDADEVKENCTLAEKKRHEDDDDGIHEDEDEDEDDDGMSPLERSRIVEDDDNVADNKVILDIETRRTIGPNGTVTIS